MSRPSKYAKDQHVADFNSICDDVLTNRECSNARSEILVTSATDLRVACEQEEPRGDRVDETVRRIGVAALRGDVIPNAVGIAINLRREPVSHRQDEERSPASRFR